MILQWEKICDGGLRCRAELSGKEYRLAAVHQGGDGRWTSWVQQFKYGRPKKRGSGRIPSKLLRMAYLEPRPVTQAEALKWAEETWETFNNQTH